MLIAGRSLPEIFTMYRQVARRKGADMTKGPRHTNGGAYILTHDLGERIESLRLLGLKTLDATDPYFSDLHGKIKERISSFLPETEVVTYDMKNLVEKIWSKAISLKSNLRDAVVVSSCAEVSTARRGHTIEINRIVDENGEFIGLGPRPGHPSLTDQFNGIAAATHGNSVILAEDGTFTGSTVIYLLNQLQARGVKIAAVVIGISFPSGIAEIKKVFDGEIVVVQETMKPFEWMPDHDFIPFAPNCGRVYGAKFGREILPHYTYDGVSYSFPYILPFGNLVKWASIPQEHALDFSRFCIGEARDLFGKLEDLNHKQITVKDLLGAQPRISAPMTKGSGQFPNIDIPITSFLREVLQEF